MARKTKAEREEMRLRNEADRDYPRTLAKLKKVLAAFDASLARQLSGTDARTLRQGIAELVVLACEEQDAATARQFKEAIGVVGKITETFDQMFKGWPPPPLRAPGSGRWGLG
jgi:hypothetical protein